MDASHARDQVVAPGWAYLLQRFGGQLPEAPALGPGADLRSATGLLLNHLPALRSLVKTATFPASVREDLANPHKFSSLLAVFAPPSQGAQPVIFDRTELEHRCRDKERRFFAARNKPITDPEKRLAETGNAVFTVLGFRPSTPPGNGALDPGNHAFEFFVYKQILEYLAVNRSKLNAATRRGHFAGGERDELLEAGRQFGFSDEALAELPELGLLLLELHDYVVDSVVNLHCEAVDDGVVPLRWDLPASTGARCDSVQIERRMADSEGEWEVIARGVRVASHNDDRSHCRGESFRYRVRSIYKNTLADDGPSVDAFVPDEPRNPVWRWSQGGVELAWVAARGSARTVLFRRSGGEPQFAQGNPLDAETQLAGTVEHEGATEAKFRDCGIQPGRRYYYRLFALYPDGTRSQGVVLRNVDIPTPPKPPQRVSAQYGFDAATGKGHVAIRVAGVAPGLNCRVERISPSSEEPVTEKLDETTWIDRAPEARRTFLYRVAVLAEGLESRPVTSNPIDTVPGVTNVSVEILDRGVKLHYVAHPAAMGVTVRRARQSPPVHPGDGDDVDANTVIAYDTNLQNNICYHYSLFCRYRMPDGREVFSPPYEAREVVPKVVPQAVRLRARVENGQIVCTATDAPRAGSLRVYRLRDRRPDDNRWPPFAFKETVPIADLDRLGDPLPVSGLRAVDSEPDPREPYYIVFSVWDSEGVAFAGGPTKLALVPDVEELKCYAVAGGVRLKWKWPTCVQRALVLCEDRGYPDLNLLAKDNNAWYYQGRPIRLLDRSQFEEEGDSCLLDVDPTSGQWHVLVLAVVGDSRSEGTAPGCRAVVPNRQRIRLAYFVQQEGQRLHLRWRVEPPETSSFRFHVCASPEVTPNSLASGRQVFTVAPGGTWPQAAPDGFRQWEAPNPFGTAKAHCRLFVDAEEPLRDEVDVRHPDDLLRPLRPPPALAFGSQRRLRCPYCFGRFGWWQVRMSDEKLSKEWRLAWWIRLQGALNLQRTAPAGVLQGVNTLCPAYCREARAGGGQPVPLDNALFLQPAMHLGLIGSSRVGKSHWLFSVYRRLESFGLTIMDAQTKERCDEMKARVIENRVPLKITQPGDESTLRPLLFNATWNHGGHKAMVLALHDVDGESWGRFGEAGKIRYLREAGGLVYLIDPLQLPNVRTILAEAGRLPEDAPEVVDQGIAVDNLDQAFRKRAGTLKENPMPLAVVVSKGDVAWQVDPVLREALRDAPIYHPGGASPRYDVALHWRVQFAVRGFLSTYAPGLIAKIEGRYANVAYFCVSPTGGATHSQKFARFAPWRVEEPVLWLFSRLGIIPTI